MLCTGGKNCIWLKYLLFTGTKGTDNIQDRRSCNVKVINIGAAQSTINRGPSFVNKGYLVKVINH